MDAHGRRWILTGRVPLRMSVSRQGPSASFRHGVGTVRYAPRYSAPPVYMCCRVRGRCSAAGRTRARCVPCSVLGSWSCARGGAEARRGRTHVGEYDSAGGAGGRGDHAIMRLRCLACAVYPAPGPWRLGGSRFRAFLVFNFRVRAVAELAELKLHTGHTRFTHRSRIVRSCDSDFCALGQKSVSPVLLRAAQCVSHLLSRICCLAFAQRLLR